MASSSEHTDPPVVEDPTSSGWLSLIAGLPSFVNTHDAHEVLAELEAVEDRTDVQQERLESLIALRDALGADWDRMTEEGGTLNAEDDWTKYQEELAYDSGDITKDSTVADYVDWDGYAEALKNVDTRGITVESGEFAGSWLYGEY